MLASPPHPPRGGADLAVLAKLFAVTPKGSEPHSSPPLTLRLAFGLTCIPIDASDGSGAGSGAVFPLCGMTRAATPREAARGVSSPRVVGFWILGNKNLPRDGFFAAGNRKTLCKRLKCWQTRC